MTQRSLGDAGEHGEAACIAGLGQPGLRDVVAGGSPDCEPGRQHVGDRSELHVAGGGHPGEVRGDGLAGERGTRTGRTAVRGSGAAAAVCQGSQALQAAVMPWPRSSRVKAE